MKNYSLNCFFCCHCQPEGIAVIPSKKPPDSVAFLIVNKRNDNRIKVYRFSWLFIFCRLFYRHLHRRKKGRFLLSSGFSEKKKIPPIPVTFGVVSCAARALSDWLFSLYEFFVLFMVRLQPVSAANKRSVMISLFMFCFLYLNSSGKDK